MTFDEDDGKSGNHIPTLVVGPGVSPGMVSDARFDHYSLLRSVEDMFGLKHLLHAGDPETKSLLAPFVRGL